MPLLYGAGAGDGMRMFGPTVRTAPLDLAMLQGNITAAASGAVVR